MRAGAGQAVVLYPTLTTEEDHSRMAAGGAPLHGVGQWAVGRAPGPVWAKSEKTNFLCRALGRWAE